MGGQYITQAIARGGHTRRLKYFTHAQLKRAAQLAFERDYNRQLPLDVVDELPTRGHFPITFELPHKHEHGKPVPMHMRCCVVLDAEGRQGWVDCDMDLYRSLDTYEASDPRRVSTPSPN
jgi:hypothetical protein